MSVASVNLLGKVLHPVPDCCYETGLVDWSVVFTKPGS